MAVSLDKPAVWSEARGYSVGYLWNYLDVVYGYWLARQIYWDLKLNNPQGFANLLRYHFRYDNFTGELKD